MLIPITKENIVAKRRALLIMYDDAKETNNFILMPYIIKKLKELDEWEKQNP